eukprot:5169-Heterococcus_DN1.PRE.5
MHRAKCKHLNMCSLWKVTLSAAPTACVTLEKMLPMLLKPSDKLDKYSMKATIAPASSCPLLSWKQTIYSSKSVDSTLLCTDITMCSLPKQYVHECTVALLYCGAYTNAISSSNHKLKQR